MRSPAALILALVMSTPAAWSQARHSRVQRHARATPPSAQSAAAPMEFTLTSMRGTVDVVEAGSFGRPRPAHPGEVVARGIRIRVGEDGFANLVRADGVSLTLMPGARLTAFGSSSGNTSSMVTTLEAGTVRASTPTSHSEPFLIDTRGASVSVRRGDGVIEVGAGSESFTRVSAHHGRILVRVGHDECLLRPEQGVTVEPARRSHKQPVASAPRWTERPPERVTTLGNAVDVGGAFAPSGRAPVVAWRAELARDESFHDIVAIERLDAGATRWQGRRLAQGTYFVRVSALDEERYESVPSAAARVEIRGPVVDPGADARDGEAGRLATVSVPSGVFCGLDGAVLAPIERPIRLTPARAHSVRCATTLDGADAQDLAVSASESGVVHRSVQVRVTNVGEGLITVRLTDAEGYGIPYANIVVTPSAGLTIGPVREERERGVYRAPVFWRGSNPPPINLGLSLNHAVSFHARIDGDDQVEATIVSP